MKRSFKDFWVKEAYKIKWLSKPKKVLDKYDNKFVWFNDGKINAFDTCIEQNLLSNRNKICINYYDKNKILNQYSYAEVSEYVKKFSYQIKKTYKRKKINNLIIYGAASIETSIAIFACAQLGIHFSVIFQDLSFDAVKLRTKLLKADILISRCTDTKFYKKIFKTKLFNKKNIIFFHKDENLNLNNIKKIDLNLLKKSKQKINIIKKTNSNKDFFTLFTSGSTGQPKGITHSTGNYLVYANHTCRKKFGMKKSSIVLTASDAGWINGHTYALFGPLSIGCSTLILERPGLLIDEVFLKQVVSKCQVSILYLPVTLIRMMKSLYVKKIKNKSIKTLGSMGEPLAEDVGNWYSKYFNLKNKAIINTYFQTETGGVIASPTFKQNTKTCPHGSVGNTSNKFLKIFIDKKDNNQFKIKNYWPGMMKNIINGKKIFLNYFDSNGYFKLFDTGNMINNNYYVHGRIDDVLNIRGHRIGSGEIESVILSIKDIKEASVIDTENSITGKSISVFVSLKKNINHKEILKSKINSKIINIFGKFALPEKIIFVKDLPKTKSGKILRRLLRSIYLNKKPSTYGDLSTILDPSCIKDIKIATKQVK